MSHSAKSEEGRLRSEDAPRLQWSQAALLIVVLSAVAWALVIAVVLALWSVF